MSEDGVDVVALNGRRRRRRSTDVIEHDAQVNLDAIEEVSCPPGGGSSWRSMSSTSTAAVLEFEMTGRELGTLRRRRLVCVRCWRAQIPIAGGLLTRQPLGNHGVRVLFAVEFQRLPKPRQMSGVGGHA